MLTIVKIIIGIIAVFVVGQFAFFFFFDDFFDSPESKLKIPETIDTDLSEEEIQGMHDTIEIILESECRYLKEGNFKKSQNVVKPLFFSEEFKSTWSDSIDPPGSWKECKIIEIDFGEPMRFKSLSDRIAFLVDVEMLHHMQEGELSTDTDITFYFFKKDTDGKWKIEEVRYILFGVETFNTAQKTIQKLNKKDAGEK